MWLGWYTSTSTWSLSFSQEMANLSYISVIARNLSSGHPCSFLGDSFMPEFYLAFKYTPYLVVLSELFPPPKPLSTQTWLLLFLSRSTHMLPCTLWNCRRNELLQIGVSPLLSVLVADIDYCRAGENCNTAGYSLEIREYKSNSQ